MSEHVHVRREGGTIEAVLDRPEKKNAITADMYAAIADAIEQAGADPSVRCVLISSVGDTFCAGNDLQDFLGSPAISADSPVARFLAALARAQVPIVVAVQGPAVGVGATMLLHADYVVAADSASLVYPFASMALVPEAGSSLLLPRVTGYLRAAEILLLGEPVPAARAYELGLVSRVVPAGTESDEARAFVDRLERRPPAAVRLTKRLMRTDESTLSERMEAELALFVEQLSSPEFIEAVTAFMEKRDPVF